MYICLCRVVTRKAIETVIQSGARTVDEVALRSGAGTECGKCRRNIGKLIEIHRNTATSASPPLMHNSN